MLISVLKKYNASYAIAVSGIAGPNGGTQDKPVGTVAIGVMNQEHKEDISIFNFFGNRKEIQIQSAKWGLNKTLKFIL
jgi:nicotinamide-nucleotide amidase